MLMMIDDSSNDDLADIALRIGRVCPCVPPPAATAAGINDRLSLLLGGKDGVSPWSSYHSLWVCTTIDESK